MNHLSLAQISQLLQQQDIQPDTLDMLQNDRRSSVARLLNSYRRNQAKRLAEEARLQAMFSLEEELYCQGFRYIAGVDEAGRGPLAGPVVIGAVVLPRSCYLPLLNDSKQLGESQRETLYNLIRDMALAASVSIVPPDVIDSVNIYQATVQGMYDALAQLSPRPDMVLIDAVPLPRLSVPSRSIIGGDALSASIAAASVIAKVERDHLMKEYDAMYPQYGFAGHKGYATKEHQIALRKHGPCPIHRQTFEPIKSMVMVQETMTLF